MGLIGKLFRSGNRAANLYVDSGAKLTRRLVESLGLAGWDNGFPNYTPEEMDAINSCLSRTQRMYDENAPTLAANLRSGGKLAEGLLRIDAASALEDLAGDRWKHSEKLPKHWKDSVSTYLKAFACNLNPSALLEMADLLAAASYKNEAREALRVVLTFPSYAHIKFAGAKDYKLTADAIMKSAQQALREL